MASRTELYQITRELRRYLEWQAAGGAPGVMPAPVAEREAWQELEKAREVERAQAMREALFGAPSARAAAVAKPEVTQNTSAERGESQPAKVTGSRLDAVMGPDRASAPSSSAPAKTSSSVPTSSGGGLWNDFGSRPRPTFHAVEEPAPSSASPASSSQRSPSPASSSQRSSSSNQFGSQSSGSQSRSQPAKPSVNQQASQRPAASNRSDNRSEPEPIPVSFDADDFGGYDESYIDYSEDYSEFSFSEPPVVAEKVVEKVVEKPARRKEMTNAEKLDFLKKYLGDCRRCALHRGRTQVVFGDGNPTARIMFIGEGPGVEEDRQGVPFVGEAGELLNKMIGAMGFKREEVYVASVVKCRSSENRNPVAGEVAECSPFLLKQIEAVKPEVIVALGGLAAQTLLGNTANLTQLRGRWHVWKEIPVMPTYNPNSLLKNDRLKRDAWSDLQMVMARLAEKK